MTDPINTNLTPAQTKALVKEALKEWLDEKFLTFGKWSAAGLGALAFSAILYLILFTNGWKPA